MPPTIFLGVPESVVKWAGAQVLRATVDRRLVEAGAWRYLVAAAVQALVQEVAGRAAHRTALRPWAPPILQIRTAARARVAVSSCIIEAHASGSARIEDSFHGQVN